MIALGRAFKSYYDRLLAWAASPRGLRAIGVVSFVEASFFPIPPDVLLVAAVLANPRIWLRAALVCSVASVLGGATGYLIGWGVWEAVDGLFFAYVPGFSEATYAKMAGLYDEWSFWIVFAAGFTPIPYKIFTIAAGAAKIGFPLFLLASAISRTARFLLVAGTLRWLGPQIKPLIDRHFGWLTLAFTALLIAGFAALKLFVH